MEVALTDTQAPKPEHYVAWVQAGIPTFRLNVSGEPGSYTSNLCNFLQTNPSIQAKVE